LVGQTFRMAGFSKLSKVVRWPVLGITALALHGAVLGVGLLNTRAPLELEPQVAPIEFSISLAATDAAREVAAPATPQLPARPAAAAALRPHQPAERRPEHHHKPARSEKVPPAPTVVSPGEATSASLPRPAVAISKAVAALRAPTTGDGAASSLAASVTGRTVAAGADAETDARGSTLAAKPRLLSAASACHGVISQAVFGSPTKVTIVVRVGTDGAAAPTDVRAEGHGDTRRLNRAALECTRRLRFSPARNARGEQVTASSVLRLTISNHYSAHAPVVPVRREGHI
jgi:hypothetical protein